MKSLAVYYKLRRDATLGHSQEGLDNAHGIYVDAIIAGIKTVEYRTRVRKNAEVSTVLIYRSGDQKKIVAEFTIGGILEGTPEQIWEQTKAIGGIEENAYFRYFANRDRAYAYQICNLLVYPEPVPLRSLGVKNPPMSFMYIE